MFRVIPSTVVLVVTACAGWVTISSTAQGQERRVRNRPAPHTTIQVDLTPSVRQRLITDRIPDEDSWVSAEKGHQFVRVPFLYQVEGSLLSLNRTGIRGKGVKGCYGFFIPTVESGQMMLESAEARPVYERLEFAVTEQGDCQLTARNLSASRKAEGEKSGGIRFKPSNDSHPCSGSAIVILEVAEGTKQIAFTLGGTEEVIDLDQIHHAGQIINVSTALEGEGRIPPEIAEAIEVLSDGTATAAALQLARLVQSRPTWPDAKQASWVTAVDTTVLSSAMHDSALVHSEAWRYFNCVSQPEKPCAYLSGPVLDFLSAADETLQSRWVKLIRCARNPSRCRMEWARPGMAGHTGETTSATSMAILCAILRGDEAGSCEAAASELLNLAGEKSDWRMLEGASEIGQQMLVERLGKLKSARIARKLLKILLESPQPGAASSLADEAQRRRIVIMLESDSLLSSWERVGSAEDRLAVLTVLQGVDLGPLLYSEKITKLLTSPIEGGSGDDGRELRELGWEVYLRHLERRHAEFVKTEQARDGKPGQGPFPLLVSVTMRDPVLDEVRGAARRGPREMRSRALTALLHEGLAEEAARALMDADTTPQMREALLKDLTAKKVNQTAQDAFVAMLGQLLHWDNLSGVASILTRLNQMRKTMAEPQRWRMTAAMKAGLNFAELDHLTTRLAGSAAEEAVVLLHELAHMTPQDRQRLAASKSAERGGILDRIDFRRGQIVDGVYGVLAVIETLEPVVPSEALENVDGESVRGATPRGWFILRRRTVMLPEITMESIEGQEPGQALGFRVLNNKQMLGEGLKLNKPRSVGGPGRFSPALESVEWRRVYEGNVMGPGETAAVGPLLLPHRALLESLAPGTMNLEVGKYLRDGLQAGGLLSKREAQRQIPASLKMTLRYASFGSYYGVCPDLPIAAEQGDAPRPRLMNVMLVLERKE